MIALASGLEMDDYNNAADLVFDDVAAATATADFLVVNFPTIVTSAAKVAVDSVSTTAFFATVGIVVLIYIAGSTDRTTTTGGGNAGAKT